MKILNVEARVLCASELLYNKEMPTECAASAEFVNYHLARYNMIEQQIKPWQVSDERILDLFFGVRREEFIPSEFADFSLSDTELPIGHGQYTMTPKMEARMLQSLAICPEDRILEVGTGIGFVTTLLSILGGQVYSIDIHRDFVDDAKRKLAQRKISNAQCIHANGSQGWNNKAPYDVIAFTGSVQQVGTGLLQQLACGGRLFAVIGVPPIMEAVLVTRENDEQWQRISLFDTFLRPLEKLAHTARFVL